MDAPLRREPVGPAPATGVWQVRLLGAVEARLPDGRQVRTFPTRPVAALLARLALSPRRVHARETLIEELWPGVAPDLGRNRLRHALSVLKALLERDVDRAGPLLLADRVHVRVADGSLACDAVEFERAAQRGDRDAALAMYLGDLMPGHYLEWVNDARERLAALHEALSVSPAPERPGGPRVQVQGLPAYLTRAFGIAPWVERLLAALATDRLVTVHGPGGSGKTRLAVQAAQALASQAEPRFRRVAFVPLADCASADRMVEAVAQAVGAVGSGSSMARVRADLFGEPALLLLDNVEQLQADAVAAIPALLASLPQLRIVVTSRRLLGIDGELALSLTGLGGTSASCDPAGPDADAPSAAVALFVDRARTACGSFAARGADLAAIDDAMRRLDGLPLAIELAASRLRGMGLNELLHHLRHGSSLDLLARNLASSPGGGRHDSMRQVLQWSWSLLSPDQRKLMRALATFAAPALPQAVAHLAGSGLGPVRAGLESLKGLSMARSASDARGRHRWSLLQPVREFVAEQRSADEARAARMMLCDWLLSSARSPDAVDAADERAQALAAIEAATAGGALQQAVDLALALRPQWELYPMPLSTQLALEHALQAGATGWPTGVRSRVHELLSMARGVAGHPAEALRHAERAVDLAEGPQDRCVALARWAWAAYYDGRFDLDFEAAFDEGERCARECGDTEALAVLLRAKVIIVCNLRLDFAEAERITEQCADLFARIGNRAMMHLALSNLAILWAGRGRTPDALQLLEEVRRAMLADGDRVGAVACLRQHGRVMLGERRFAEAAALLRDSVRLGWQVQMMQGVAQSLLHLPSALLHEDAPAAARLLGFAVAHWDRLYLSLNPIEQRELKRSRRLMGHCLGAGRVQLLMLAGRSLSLHAALELAVPGLVEDTPAP